MRLRRSPLPLTLVLALFAACGQPPDAGIAEDAGAPAPGLEDAGLPDAGAPARARTLVQVRYPAGTRTLSLRGSAPPLSWDTGTSGTRGPDDLWTFDLGDVSAPLELKPLLDDTAWARGPNVVVRPGETLALTPRFQPGAGQVVLQWPAFASHALGNSRPVWVYLPPGYAENPHARYPVLYLHDGQNLFDAAQAFGGTEWRVDEALNAGAEALPREEALRELLVVGVGNTSARLDEYTVDVDASLGAGGRGAAYLQFLVSELKPQVDAAFRTRPGREDTAVGGSSLGGLISLHAGLRHPATFGRVLALSPSTWWNDRSVLAGVNALAGQTLRPLRVYLDSGDGGPSSDDAANTAALAEAFRAVGYRDEVDFRHVLAPGATHTESAWAARLPAALRFLFPVP
jgi:predicted alpha/beta superfamily hydrolase